MSAMTAAAGAAAGSSPPAPAIQTGSRDDSALIWCGTGASGTTTGTFLTVTFGANYTSSTDGNTDSTATITPRVQVTFIYPSSAAAAAGLYVSSVTPRTVVISALNAWSATGLASTHAGIGVVLRMDF